jgi:outer membrane protein
MERRIGMFIGVFLLSCLGLPAQQITRFAVVDLTKVYTQFFRESRTVREFEERSAQIQTEMDRMNREIQELRSAQLSAERDGNQERALELSSEVYRRSQFLQEYYEVKTAELDSQRSRLAQSGSFLDQISQEIQLIAESEGYTMVLNLRDNTGILWYSPAVDITDKLVQNLRTKTRR